MNQRLRKISVVSTMTVALMAFATGCGKSGSLKIGLTDAPVDTFEAVTVNIKEIQLVGGDGKENGGNTVSALTFADGEKKYNLLDLQNTVAELGSADIPAGKYHQIRLIVHESGNTADAMAGCSDGSDCSEKPMKIASGTVTGAKLLFPGGFTVEADKENSLTIDWDLESSEGSQIQYQDGEYLMTPVLKMVTETTSAAQ